MIIVEGIDGTGKTTLVNKLELQGFKKFHFDYDKKTEDLYNKYLEVLNSNGVEKYVFDRSFISEAVYGPVFRAKSRLSGSQLVSLAKKYNERECILIYLKASKKNLLRRRLDDSRDYFNIKNFYKDLCVFYENTMNLLEEHINIFSIDTDSKNEIDVFRSVLEIVNKSE
jgi:thymidylate kinase